MLCVEHVMNWSKSKNGQNSKDGVKTIFCINRLLAAYFSRNSLKTSITVMEIIDIWQSLDSQRMAPDIFFGPKLAPTSVSVLPLILMQIKERTKATMSTLASFIPIPTFFINSANKPASRKTTAKKQNNNNKKSCKRLSSFSGLSCSRFQDYNTNIQLQSSMMAHQKQRIIRKHFLKELSTFSTTTHKSPSASLQMCHRSCNRKQWSECKPKWKWNFIQT